MKFKDLPKESLPRERLKEYGSEALSNEELLSIIIKTGNKKYSVKEISELLLNELKNISNLKNITFQKLVKIPGIGEVKALEFLAIIELSKRLNYQYLNKKIKLTNPSTIINYFNHLFDNHKQEEFYVIYLDNKKKYLNKKLLFKGTLNKTTIHPREIFKEAYLAEAEGIICMHNHPSGDATPSREDIEATKMIYQLSIIHGITLIDHIIVGNDNYFSFYENNYLKSSNKTL